MRPAAESTRQNEPKRLRAFAIGRFHPSPADRRCRQILDLSLATGVCAHPSLPSFPVSPGRRVSAGFFMGPFFAPAPSLPRKLG